MTLRCFVAMALGHKEIDKVYDNLIVPTLVKYNIKTIRIDRIEHNEDIDDRIIVEIKRCDFAIADLTYARPSVYFEAGFAQRNVPVIYTCRKDHFYPKKEDKFGNFRVHFDLQMKNIIPWSTDKDATFVKSLRKRINSVISPIFRLQQATQRKKIETEKFRALPLKEKIEKIYNICTNHLNRAGYCEFKPTRLVEVSRYPNVSFWLGKKFSKGVFYGTLVFVTYNINKKQYTDLFDDYRYYQKEIYKGIGTNKIKQIEEDWFICTLQKIIVSRFSTYIPDYKLDKINDQFIKAWGRLYPEFIESLKIPKCRRIHLLDSINSKVAFQESFTNLLKKIS